MGELEDRLLRFQDRHQQIAAPLRWMFKRQDLTTLMGEIQTRGFFLAASTAQYVNSEQQDLGRCRFLVSNPY